MGKTVEIPISEMRCTRYEIDAENREATIAAAKLEIARLADLGAVFINAERPSAFNYEILKDEKGRELRHVSFYDIRQPGVREFLDFLYWLPA